MERASKRRDDHSLIDIVKDGFGPFRLAVSISCLKRGEKGGRLAAIALSAEQHIGERSRLGAAAVPFWANGECC